MIDIHKRADVARRYLYKKDERVSAKLVEDLHLALCREEEKVSNLNRQLNSKSVSVSDDQ